MFIYIVNSVPHTDTSDEYLQRLGLEDEVIESIIRDADAAAHQEHDQQKVKAQETLASTSYMVETYREQKELGVKTDITAEQYKQALMFREQLRKM